MASSKRQTTFAKLQREQAVKEKRLRKLQKKQGTAAPADDAPAAPAEA
jgi:hypothetical protein